MKGVAFETFSLNLLKTFCVFAETGLVEETAQKLKITQASVSLQLKKLEDESGQKLFETVGRKKLLSKFARDLFQSIAPPLKELELRLKEVSKTQLTWDRRILRIGCEQDLIKRITPRLKFPGEVQLKAMSSDEAITALKNDEIDMALGVNPKSTEDWYTQKIFTDQPVLIANPKILKSKNWDHITTELLDHSAISFKKSNPLITEVCDHLGGTSASLKIKLFVEDWPSIIETVKENPNWSVLPRDYGSELQGLTVAEIPSRVLKSSSVYSIFGKEWRGVRVFDID